MKDALPVKSSNAIRIRSLLRAGPLTTSCQAGAPLAGQPCRCKRWSMRLVFLSVPSSMTPAGAVVSTLAGRNDLPLMAFIIPEFCPVPLPMTKAKTS